MSSFEKLPREQVLQNISSEFRALEAKLPQATPSTDDPEDVARLDNTITELQEHIAQARATLAELKAQHPSTSALNGPSSDPATQLRQVQTLTRAYTALAAEPPYLPSRPSALPYLLSHRSTAQQIADAQAAIPAAYESAAAARRRLADEAADLQDNQTLRDALQERLAELRSGAASQERQRASPEQTARRLVAEAAQRAKAHGRQARQLTRALARFIEADLGAKLAAEELGGPVAGSAPALDDDALAGGFAASGRPKRTSKPVADDKRQRRIDEIWGEPEGADGFDGEEGRSEAQAAAAEMRDLVEELLNAAAESGAARYVVLRRDSAAARFLVRAGVAVLHRSDARRIRLLEFGREIED